MKNAWKDWFLRIDFWKKFEIKTESDSSSGIFEVPPVRDTPYLEQALSQTLRYLEKNLYCTIFLLKKYLLVRFSTANKRKKNKVDSRSSLPLSLSKYDLRLPFILYSKKVSCVKLAFNFISKL